MPVSIQIARKEHTSTGSWNRGAVTSDSRPGGLDPDEPDWSWVVRCRGADGAGVRVVAVLAGQEKVAVPILLVRRLPVAVVVDAVANLLQTGGAAGMGVVAVLAGEAAVQVIVDFFLPGGSVAVVVLSIARLEVFGRPARVVVVAVPTRERPILIAVDLVARNLTVAVIVHPVARLGRSGSPIRVGVVAVLA